MRLDFPALVLALTVTPTLVAAQLQIVVTSGKGVPGSMAVFRTFDAPVLNDGRRILFWFRPANSFDPEGIALWRPKSLTVALDEDDPVPMGAIGETYASLRDSGPAINASGDFVVGGRIDLVGAPGTHSAHFFVDATTGPELVAREGQVEPGGDGTLFFRSGVHAPLNSGGSIAFSGSLLGTSGGGSDDEAIYRWDGTGSPLVEIVRKGNAPPNGNGTFTGTAFQASQAFADPSMNSTGVVVFQASGVIKVQ